MCVQISDSVVFWTRSEEIKFLVLETSCITHTRTCTRTRAHTQTHTHLFIIRLFRQWQTEIEKTLSKKLSSIWGWTFYWNVNIWEQSIFSYNFIFTCYLKWIYFSAYFYSNKKWWWCLSIRQPLSKMWKHQNPVQRKNVAYWKKCEVTFCVWSQLK